MAENCLFEIIRFASSSEFDWGHRSESLERKSEKHAISDCEVVSSENSSGICGRVQSWERRDPLWFEQRPNFEAIFEDASQFANTFDSGEINTTCSSRCELQYLTHISKQRYFR
jgi:hypothetical protein